MVQRQMLCLIYLVKLHLMLFLINYPVDGATHDAIPNLLVFGSVTSDSFLYMYRYGTNGNVTTIVGHRYF